MTYRIKYLRDSKNFPVGCLAIHLPPAAMKKTSMKKTATKKKVSKKKVSVKKSTKLSYQFSVLNPRDDFNREHGRQLALGRLVENPQYVTVTGKVSKHKITEVVLRDLITLPNVPTRALKAARLWLKNNLTDK